MGSRGQGATAQLPRTTPHISSTHHRLVRQGYQTKEVSLMPNRLLASASPSAALSNFRDASSSRSLTPHPFVGNSLKKPHNLPVAPGPTAGQVGPSSNDASIRREHGPGYQTLGSSSMSAATNRHPPAPHAYYQGGGFFGTSTKLVLHSKGAYSSGGEVGGGEAGPGCVPSTSSPLSSDCTCSNGSNPSAAASFFAKATQKVGASSKKKKHRTVAKEKSPQAFPTNFSAVILKNPPPVPRNLLRPIGRTQNALSGKVRVMLRVCPVEGAHSSFLTIDPQKSQVTAYDPAVMATLR